jgi:hypothetical protein
MRRLNHCQPNRRIIRKPHEVLQRAMLRKMLMCPPHWSDMYCEDCVKEFCEKAERDRPGHVWTVDEGKIIYLEDKVVEMGLGRPLAPNESVIHRDDNPLNNRRENLELIVIESLE